MFQGLLLLFERLGSLFHSHALSQYFDGSVQGKKQKTENMVIIFIVSQNHPFYFFKPALANFTLPRSLLLFPLYSLHTVLRCSGILETLILCYITCFKLFLGATTLSTVEKCGLTPVSLDCPRYRGRPKCHLHTWGN